MSHMLEIILSVMGFVLFLWFLHCIGNIAKETRRSADALAKIEKLMTDAHHEAEVDKQDLKRQRKEMYGRAN